VSALCLPSGAIGLDGFHCGRDTVTMKLPFVFLAVLSLVGFSSCADFKIKGKVCYDTPQGKVCAESDGQAVTIEANLSGK
jgi:hypothetical protein